MEINVDYLGVRVVDLSGAVLGQEVETATSAAATRPP